MATGNTTNNLLVSRMEYLRITYIHHTPNIFFSETLMPRRSIVRMIFQVFQRLGIHITSNNFYGPIPDTRTLKDELWNKASELIGVNMNDSEQLQLLSLFLSGFKKEYDSFPRNKTGIPHQFYVSNSAFESIDCEILYSMIRHFKPCNIIEIGSGNSTYLMAQAIQRNKEEGCNCNLTAIDPYPNSIVKQGFPNLSNLIIKKVEDAPLSLFQKLQASDILFIDSSHVLKIGNDVQHEYLEILPRLNKGVLVHFHDIFLPNEYPKEWVLKDRTFWNEQYLLQAFLTFNNRFEVVWASAYMQQKYSDRFESAFGSFNRNKEIPPGSFWIRRIGD